MMTYTTIQQTMTPHHTALWRGYVSRKSTPDQIRVERVETGKYRGDLWIKENLGYGALFLFIGVYGIHYGTHYYGFYGCFPGFFYSPEFLWLPLAYFVYRCLFFSITVINN